MHLWRARSPRPFRFLGVETSRTRPFASRREASHPSFSPSFLRAFSSHLSLSKRMVSCNNHYSPQSSSTVSAGFNSATPPLISDTSYSTPQSLHETISPTITSLGTFIGPSHSAHLVFTSFSPPRATSLRSLGATAPPASGRPRAWRTASGSCERVGGAFQRLPG